MFSCKKPANQAPDIQRVCEKTEKFHLSPRRYAVKILFDLAFLAVLGCFVSLKTDQLEEDSLGAPFACGTPYDYANRDDGILDLFDSNWQLFYCMFKSFMVIFSLLLLIPLFMRSIRLTTITMISFLEKDVFIAIANGQYAGYEKQLDFYSWNPLKNVYLCWMTIMLLRSKRREKSKGGKRWRTPWAVLFLLLDTLNFLGMGAVTYFVIGSSTTLEDLLVKIAVMHVFATLADEQLKNVYRKRSVDGSKLSNYVKPSAAAAVGRYQPLGAFDLALHRHGMGVTSGVKGEMAKFHEYDGLSRF